MRAFEACPAKGRAPDALASAPLRAWSCGHLDWVQVSPGRLARSWGRPAGLPAAEAPPGQQPNRARYAREGAPWGARPSRDARGVACRVRTAGVPFLFL